MKDVDFEIMFVELLKILNNYQYHPMSLSGTITPACYFFNKLKTHSEVVVIGENALSINKTVNNIQCTYMVHSTAVKTFGQIKSNINMYELQSILKQFSQMFNNQNIPIREFSISFAMNEKLFDEKFSFMEWNDVLPRLVTAFYEVNEGKYLLQIARPIFISDLLNN